MRKISQHICAKSFEIGRGAAVPWDKVKVLRKEIKGEAPLA
jgi:hypothetical protein